MINRNLKIKMIKYWLVAAHKRWPEWKTADKKKCDEWDVFYKRRENCWTTCPCVEIFWRVVSGAECVVADRLVRLTAGWTDSSGSLRIFFFDGGRKSSSLTAGAQLRRWHPLDMAVRRVTRLDRQNDKHLKRHKRRAELTFTSVPILLSLPEKNAFRRTRTTSQQCLGISDFFWKFLLFIFFYLACYCK